MSPGQWPEEPGLAYLVHFLIHKDALCQGEGECNKLRPCTCHDCGHTWETAAESPDACPRCGKWKSVEIDRCYDCPLTLLDRAMVSARGALIRRVFRKHNLMLAHMTYGPDDFTVEEANVLELIQIEKNRPRPPK